MNTKTTQRAASNAPSAPSGSVRLRTLEDALLALADKDEVTRFLIDLCTPGEIEAFRQRWAIAQLLDRHMSQRDVAEKSAASIATVTRVARFLQHERHQ